MCTLCMYTYIYIYIYAQMSHTRDFNFNNRFADKFEIYISL